MLDLSVLNEAQKRAVTHSKGPAVVLAGPGSGKTFLIVSRIRYLIEQQEVSPDTILVITFTKAAALSMQRRFEESTNGRYAGVWFGTFHAFFYQILKEYDSYNQNSLFEAEEKKHYLKQIFKELKLEWDDSADYRSLTEYVPSEKPIPLELSEEQIEQVREKWRKRTRMDRKLSFDDMGELVWELLQRKPQILTELQNRFSYFFVDEYQDTNFVQEKILALLAEKGRNLMVVGDDDQSIYGFRGSSPEGIKNFMEHFPDAKMYILEKNYRSTGQIVAAADRIIRENKNRYAKEIKAVGEWGENVRCLGFSDRKEEYAYLGKRIVSLQKERNLDCSDMAVIARTNRELEMISLTLQKAGILCHGSENKKNMEEHFIIKEIIGCMEFIAGTRDRAPQIWNRISGNEEKRIFLSRLTPAAAVHYLIKNMGYEKILREQSAKETANGTAPMEEWGKILSYVTGCGKGERVWEKWIAQLKKEMNQMPRCSGEKGVRLLTMHGAKGLEFTYVCIADVNEGIIPGKRSRKAGEIEEERRLFYVAVTRAKKILDILYLNGTQEYPKLPSRFLNPLFEKQKKGGQNHYSSSSTSSSNSALSRNSSNASATASYSASSSIKISSGSAFGSFSSSR